MPDFTNWHRAASEELISAVNGKQGALDRAQHYAELELRSALGAHHLKREILARGVLRAIEELRQVPD